MKPICNNKIEKIMRNQDFPNSTWAKLQTLRKWHILNGWLNPWDKTQSPQDKSREPLPTRIISSNHPQQANQFSNLVGFLEDKIQ